LVSTRFLHQQCLAARDLGKPCATPKAGPDFACRVTIKKMDRPTRWRLRESAARREKNRGLIWFACARIGGPKFLEAPGLGF